MASTQSPQAAISPRSSAISAGGTHWGSGGASAAASTPDVQPVEVELRLLVQAQPPASEELFTQELELFSPRPV